MATRPWNGNGGAQTGLNLTMYLFLLRFLCLSPFRGYPETAKWRRIFTNSFNNLNGIQVMLKKVKIFPYSRKSN
jgi:hypothetical protein